MSNHRSSTLIKNMLYFFVASFGTKFISFFLVPLYTSVIPTEAYGVLDLLSTIVALGLPVLMLDISDAIMFFSYREDTMEGKQQPFIFGMHILRVSSILLTVALVITGFILNSKDMWIYCLYILVLYVNQAARLNVLAYMRSTNMVNAIVISGVISSFTSLFLNVFLLLVLRWGIYGLMISTIAGEMANNAYCFWATKYKKIRKVAFTLTKEQKHEMIRYSFPLIFTGMAWWVNNSLDRFFIASYCGVAANGIYAVANKIPSLLTAVHSVVYQAMQLSVFSEMKSTDSKEYMKKLYTIYNFIMVLACSTLIVLNKPLAAILFKGDYFIAWKYVPAMLISTILYSVAGYTTIIAAASSETAIITMGTISGAIVNAILNFLLIPRWNLYGAVIATVAGYFVIWLILLLKVESRLEMRFPKFQSIIMYALLVCQWIVVLYSKYNIIINIMVLGAICVINYKCIHDLWSIAITLKNGLTSKFFKSKAE